MSVDPIASRSGPGPRRALPSWPPRRAMREWPRMLRIEVDPEVLREAEVFRGLSQGDHATLVTCLQARSFHRDEIVFREGDPGTTLLLIVQGTFLATTRRPDGVEQKLHEMKPLELVGEMALLDPGPRSATVKALTPGITYELSNDTLGVLRKRSPAAASALVTAAIRDVTRRLRSLDESITRELERLGAPSAEDREP